MSGTARDLVQARDINIDVHLTPGYAVDFPVAAPVSAPLTAPLVVPQRRVSPARLHGRDQVVSALTGAVLTRASGAAAPGAWALCGLGGTGKSTVALEVAHQVGPALRHTWWLSVADPAELAAALRSVAVDAGAAPTEFNHLHPADVLWRRLDALSDPWLLVLDNIDDPDVVAAAKRTLADGTGWLRQPRTPRGTVLVTSRETRRERWGAWVELREVEPLSAADGARVLLDLAPNAGSAREAEALAADLGGLPLALDLAGSYLAATADDVWPDDDEPTTFAAYRRAFSHRLTDVGTDVAGRPRDPRQARRDLLTTWELSLDLLAGQGHGVARPLLRLLSCFAEARLPHRLVLDPDVLRGDPRFAALTARRLRDALQGLVDLRLVSVTSDDVGRALYLHPVVRASARAGRLAENLPLVAGLLARATAHLVPEDPATWARWSLLAPHCAAMARLSVDAATQDADQVRAALQLTVAAARYRLAAGLPGDAEAVLRPALDLGTTRFGSAHPETLRVRRQLARTLLETGQTRSALAEYERVLESSGAVFAPDDPHVLSARRGLGRTLAVAGRLAEAHEVLDDLVDTVSGTGRSEDDIDTVLTRYERGKLLLRLGRHDEAEREFRRLLALEGSVDRAIAWWWVSDSRFHIARSLRGQSRLAEAEAELRDCVEAMAATFSAEHPLLLAVRYERARNLRDLGDVDRAEHELRDVAAIARGRLGEEHPAAVAVRHELAAVLHLRGRLTEARAEFEAVWSTNVVALGENHPDTLMSRHNLACVLLDLGAAEDAAALFDGVVAARSAVLGRDHPDTGESERLRAAARRLDCDSTTSTEKDGPCS
ncbi:tetratricopeptide repeat protein [Saccharothrix luteola]|uniref:tetratricopeptide repeat protein n=1 Tax=Saccharothrix luteola TaxID=2893018 RepID=UPI001E3F0FED|nr:tetratricopeptide repeat protein [Saccharothrix luteola]MCC8251203.1 tetratricopeptide repeat protein [Saccharothrix luteola]